MRVASGSRDGEAVVMVGREGMSRAKIMRFRARLVSVLRKRGWTFREIATLMNLAQSTVHDIAATVPDRTRDRDEILFALG